MFRLALILSLVPIPLNGQTDAPQITLPSILQHLASEAEAFRHLAPLSLSEETLEQRARPVQPGSQFEVREVISEYGFSVMATAPHAIHEVRKVISVNGKQVTSVEKARQTMTLGIKNGDDKLKKRLLEDFEKYGLRGAATDFGQVILLFTSQRLSNYNFELKGERQIGADRLVVVGYTQKSGDSGITVFLGNAAKREALHGEISIRKKDLVPLRIIMSSSQVVQQLPVREESTVDYKYDPAGAVLPVSVVHREFVNGELVSENQFTYSAFRHIAPGAAIKSPGF